MAIYVYHRVSTEHQDFISQKTNVEAYMLRIGMDLSKVEAVYTEKITGKVKAEDRELQSLLNVCKPGDIIIVSELSRFGRNALDVESTVRYCQKNDITVHFVKEGIITRSGYDFATDIMIKVLAAVAENYLHEMKFRQAGAYKAIKDKFAKGEKHISRTGREIDHLGNEKGCDTSKARQAAIKAKRAKAQQRRDGNPAYEWVKRKLAAGWSRQQIIEEFNLQHELNPETFCVFGGGPLTKGILSKWAYEIRRNYIEIK